MGQFIKTSNRPRRKQIKSDEEMQELMGVTGKALLDRGMRAYANKLYNNILDLLYNQYRPTDYTRTWDLLKTITLVNPKEVYRGKILQAVVYMDYREMRVGRKVPGHWGQHVSVLNEDFRKNLIGVLNEGHQGGNPIYWRDGAYFLEETADWFKEYSDQGGLTMAERTHRVFSNDDGSMEQIPVGIRVRKRK